LVDVKASGKPVVTDVHVHVIPRELASSSAFAEGWGFDPAYLHQTRECIDLGGILAGLDAMGVNRAVISPQVNLLADNLPANLAERSIQLHLECFAAHIAGSPERFRAFGTVAMATPATAAEQLERVMSTPGFVGVEIAAIIGGKVPGSTFDAFWEAAEALGAWVFVHPTMRAFDSQALASVGLKNSIGNPIETAVFAATLVTAGVMERFPNLRLLLAHGGGALPGLRGRLARAQHVFPDLAGRLIGPVEESLRRFYYDSLVYDETLLASLVSWVGADHVLLASDYPFAMGLDDPARSVIDSRLDEQQQALVLEGNASALFFRD
jgi:aminocarboxymuconate-semialdehyde decarboxylase